MYNPENTTLQEGITVQLTSCLFCLDSAALLILNEQQIYLYGQIQTSQTGGHPYSDTSPYCESSLHEHLTLQNHDAVLGGLNKTLAILTVPKLAFHVR